MLSSKYPEPVISPGLINIRQHAMTWVSILAQSVQSSNVYSRLPLRNY
jgi:hypothetical protein